MKNRSRSLLFVPMLRAASHLSWRPRALLCEVIHVAQLSRRGMNYWLRIRDLRRCVWAAARTARSVRRKLLRQMKEMLRTRRERKRLREASRERRVHPQHKSPEGE
jgi:hypothetical protein